MITPRLANIVVIVVTAVWVTSFGLAALRPAYKADPQIHIVFMAVVAGAHTLKSPKRNGK